MSFVLFLCLRPTRKLLKNSPIKTGSETKGWLVHWVKLYQEIRSLHYWLFLWEIMFGFFGFWLTQSLLICKPLLFSYNICYFLLVRINCPRLNSMDGLCSPWIYYRHLQTSRTLFWTAKESLFFQQGIQISLLLSASFPSCWNSTFSLSLSLSMQWLPACKHENARCSIMLWILGCVWFAELIDLWGKCDSVLLMWLLKATVQWREK